MKLSKLVLFALCLFLALTLANSAFAQQKAQEQGSEIKAPESSQFTVYGQILYQQSEGGYFIKGDTPRGTFKIANQNPGFLEPMLQSRKRELRIEGRLTKGTNVMFIEKIGGKLYEGTSE